MFQYFDTDGAAPPHDHVAVRRTTAILDLFLHLWDDGGAIRGKIEYCSDLFDSATVRAMAHQYVVLTAGCDRCAGHARVATADRHQR